MKYFFTLIISLHIISVSAQNFSSQHFEMKQLAPNVYAAIAKNGGAAICNAAVIDLGKHVLVFDPFLTPQAAIDLRSFIEINIKKPVKYVVNSHAHNDHIRGNQVFKNATIIATRHIAEQILKSEPEDIAGEKIYAPKRAKYYDSIPASKDAWQATEDSLWSGYFKGITASFPALKTTAPTQFFSDSLTIKGTKTIVQLITYGDGHTASDLFLYLPKEKIAFMGDLLFIQHHPWLGESKPANWMNYLQKVNALNVMTLVPGHGPVGSPKELAEMTGYIESLKEIATELKGQPITNQLILAKLPAQYSSWHLRNFFVPNVKYLLKEQ